MFWFLVFLIGNSLGLFRNLRVAMSDDVIVKYQCTKVRSWRSCYQRIFCLHSGNFVTVDPANFQVTNSWSYKDLVSASPAPSNSSEEFSIVVGKDKLKFRCKYLPLLLSDLARCKYNDEFFAADNQGKHAIHQHVDTRERIFQVERVKVRSS